MARNQLLFPERRGFVSSLFSFLAAIGLKSWGGKINIKFFLKGRKSQSASHLPPFRPRARWENGKTVCGAASAPGSARGGGGGRSDPDGASASPPSARREGWGSRTPSPFTAPRLLTSPSPRGGRRAPGEARSFRARSRRRARRTEGNAPAWARCSAGAEGEMRLRRRARRWQG